MDMPAKRYSSQLRQSQVELTQRTIMEAMAAVLVEFGPSGDAIKEVAKRANVSERTIYRHYPSKEALWDAFLLWVSNKVGLERYPETAEEMMAMVPGMFAHFDSYEELLRACLDVRAWSDVWLKGRSGWKEGIDKVLTNSFPHLSDEARDVAGGIVHVLFNGITWKTLKDQWGFSGEQAVVSTQWSLNALFDELKHSSDSERAEVELQRKGKTGELRVKVEGAEVRGRHFSQFKSAQPEDGVPYEPKS